jgi:diketogulonate reductase-like aldo/keto reductase
MRFEHVSGAVLPKIGFGTWSLGGGMSADSRKDPEYLAALRSALELGYTHFDTAELYADGHAEELLGRALRETRTGREDVFLTSKVKAENLAFDDVVAACERSLKRLETDYLDLYLIHWSNPRVPLEDTFSALNELVLQGRVRHLGVSNFGLDLLQQACALAESGILTNQVPMSLADRSYSENGVLSYCQAHDDILMTAHTPLQQVKLRHNKALTSIAAARSIAPSQVALAWLTSQKRVITIPMSADPRHQRQNIEAGDLVLSPEEMHLLD